MEQRITRAKARVADAAVPFETPGAVQRSERLAAVAAMIYLVFNEGYSASGDTTKVRKPLCEEAIRLARLLLRLFPGEPEIMGLTALLLLQHARADLSDIGNVIEREFFGLARFAEFCSELTHETSRPILRNIIGQDWRVRHGASVQGRVTWWGRAQGAEARLFGAQYAAESAALPWCMRSSEDHRRHGHRVGENSLTGL